MSPLPPLEMSPFWRIKAVRGGLMRVKEAGRLAIIRQVLSGQVKQRQAAQQREGVVTTPPKAVPPPDSKYPLGQRLVLIAGGWLSMRCGQCVQPSCRGEHPLLQEAALF